MTVMKGRLGTILSVGSLALAAVVIALWITSYGRDPGFLRVSPGRHYYAARSAKGWISLFRMSPAFMEYVPATAITAQSAPVRAVWTQNAVRVLTAPHWAALGLLLVAPGVQVWAYQRRRREVLRRTHGLCLQCGYDLRASKERCPECGTPIPDRRTPQGRRLPRVRHREDVEDETEPDDRELPDEADMDQDDDIGDTRPCPYCGKPISELAEVCPHCRSYISLEDAPSRKPLWIIIGVVVCLVIILLVWAL